MSYGSDAKCSAFVHDQEQAPNMAGQGAAYPADGTCAEHCDCGANPCGNFVVRKQNPRSLHPVHGSGSH